MLKMGHFKGYIMLGSSIPHPLTRISSKRSWGGRTPAWPSPPSGRCWACPRSWWRWGHTAPALTSPAVSCTCKQRQFSLYYTLHPDIDLSNYTCECGMRWEEHWGRCWTILRPGGRGSWRGCGGCTRAGLEDSGWRTDLSGSCNLFSTHQMQLSE